MSLVVAPAEVDAIAGAIARAPLAAFDLEFASADRLVPALCLVQVAWLSKLDAPLSPSVAAQTVAAVPEVRLVDPQAVDAAPIIRALAAHPLVVAHAPRQDLALLATRFGTGMPGLVDTQLAAAFLGIGDQVGYATLAGEMLGLTLHKEQQWTDWEKRPLSDAQLAYADADVRHLPAIYAKLAARLGKKLAWVREESADIVADALAATRVTAETAWQHVGGVRALDDRARGVAIALAAWRFKTATELDKPIGQVLTDKILLELARGKPALAAIRGWKGMSPHGRTRADQIAAAMAEAGPAPAAGRAPRAPATRAQRWSEMLVAIVQLIAEDTGIAPRLLATRSDAEELARVVDEKGLEAARSLPVFSTWRREVLAEAWEGWLSGRVALVGDPTAPSGVRLLPR